MRNELDFIGFHIEVTNVTSIHISLAKASHMAMCNLKTMGKYNPPIWPKGEELETLVSSFNDYHREEEP